jgi:pyridoxine 5-phosphate synthase
MFFELAQIRRNARLGAYDLIGDEEEAHGRWKSGLTSRDFVSTGGWCTKMTARLNVNIDHVATIREARKTIEPSIITAAVICEQAGAHGITVHLRGDRRHIQDRDIELLRDVVTTYLNVEMAATEEMVGIAVRTRPDAVSLVPENPAEITTEGGLDVIRNFENVKTAVEKLRAAGIFVSIFIDPDV